MRLSQEWLNVFAACPRRFQHIYLEQLSVPISLDQQKRLRWGTWFHLLMQQRALGLEMDWRAVAEHGLEYQLQQCVERLIEAVPERFQPQPHLSWQSEHRRTHYVQGHLLTVVYDLLVLEPERAQIFDWKTCSCPQHPEELAQDWQTRLYLFVLAETSKYAPEQISMTYWFVQPDAAPQSIQVKYSRTLHRNTQQELGDLLNQLDRSLEQYQAGTPFSQVNLAAGLCDTCSLAGRCQRSQTGSIVEEPPDWAEVEEVLL